MPMNIEIVSEKDNKTLSRKEIDFRVDHIGGTTPSRADVRAKISAQFDADLSTVVIKSLKTRYGIGMTEGSARIYSDTEIMKRVENEYILKRDEQKKKEAS